MLVISVIDTKVLENHFVAQRPVCELLEEGDFALKIIDPGGQAGAPSVTSHKVSRPVFQPLIR